MDGRKEEKEGQEGRHPPVRHLSSILSMPPQKHLTQLKGGSISLPSLSFENTALLWEGRRQTQDTFPSSHPAPHTFIPPPSPPSHTHANLSINACIWHENINKKKSSIIIYLRKACTTVPGSRQAGQSMPATCCLPCLLQAGTLIKNRAQATMEKP